MQAYRWFAGVAVAGGTAMTLSACGSTGTAMMTPTYPTHVATAAAVPARPAPRSPQTQQPGGQRQAQRAPTGSNKPYEVDGKWYTPADQPDYN